MSDLKEFKLPDVGEGLTEADIIRWHVKPGDTVTVNQIIVEIETAKAVVELPSPYAGTVSALLVSEGTTADVGTPIISVDVGLGPQPGRIEPPADDLVPAPPKSTAAEPEPEPERQSVLVGYGVKLGSTTRRARKTPPAPAANGGPAHAPERGTTDAPERSSVLAKPP